MLKTSLTELSDQLRSAAELESHLAINLLPNDERVRAAAFVNQRLWRALAWAINRACASKKTRLATAKAEVRRAVLAKVNDISLELIQRAKDGFDTLASSQVNISVNTANTGDEPNFEAFDFQQLPFIRYHSDALGAALRLRSQPEAVQLDALRMLHCRCEMVGFELQEGIDPPASTAETNTGRHRRNAIFKLHEQLKARLPLNTQEDSNDFYDCIEIGSIHPYAVPICVPLAPNREDRMFISEAFRLFGRELIIPFELRLLGSERHVTNAEGARLLYESSGVGLQVLSAWLKALDLLDSSSHCSICYRHASAISRCSAHATKTYETPEARLGKQIRPRYLARLRRYVKTPPVKKLVRSDLAWERRVHPVLLAAAERTQLGPMMRRQAIMLAHQLRDLLVVMSEDMQVAGENLFGNILDATTRIEAPRPLANLAEIRAYENLLQQAKILLSIKGFCRAWCGSGRYSPEIDLKMLGFDRDHPVVAGRALAARDIPMLMVGQRAWTEATDAFLAATAPSAEDIERLLRRGHSKHYAAKQLGIALSTVYKILQRGTMARRRQHFG